MLSPRISGKGGQFQEVGLPRKQKTGVNKFWVQKKVKLDRNADNSGRAKQPPFLSLTLCKLELGLDAWLRLLSLSP